MTQEKYQAARRVRGELLTVVKRAREAINKWLVLIPIYLGKNDLWDVDNDMQRAIIDYAASR